MKTNTLIQLPKFDYSSLDFENFINYIKENINNFNSQDIRKIHEYANNFTFDNNGETISEQLYLFINNVDSRPTCNCGKQLRYCGLRKGYKKYCSSKCQMNNSDEIKRIKQTKKERYGDENYNNKKKAIKTNLVRYDAKTPLLNDNIKKKIKNTNLKKYGVDNPLKSKEIHRKINDTNLRKYGVKRGWNLKNNIDKNIEIKKENYYNSFIEKGFTPLFDINDYVDIKNKYQWQCNKCGNKFESTVISLRCLKCSPNNISTPENELINFIPNNINKKTNDRSLIGKELDIYLPDHSIAIEFDGLYWHSDRFKDKFYHINKTKDCEEKGIRLIHIFEDEWLEKKEIVESRLKNLLGLNGRRIGARKTIIKEITPKDKNLFLDTYHIQGKDNSNVKLGAFHEDELIGVMTFAKPRVFMGKKAVEGTWELTRFATVADTYTPGLASKMLKYFERGWSPKVIESFADRRWSRGNLYKQLGFDLVSETQPNYFYFKDNKKRYHRYKFRKSELKGFENYSPDKTEKQIMDEAGWFRIYDCGNYKFIKEYY
jgi:hypothetical protein